MDLREAAGDPELVVRILLAVGLAVVAINSLRKGKRVNGLLAGGGALALGYTATSRSTDPTGIIDLGTADEDTELHCAICGDPIVPGQPRAPNESNRIVHVACKEAAE